MKLNIGCNKHRLEGYVNTDIIHYDATDMVHSAIHLPFKENSIEEIYAGHLLEHLTDPLGFFIECHRVLCDNGKLVIVIPDPTKSDTDDPMTIGTLFGFWLIDGQPDPDIPTGMHRSWWTAELLYSIAGHMGFVYEYSLHPWDDEHLVIGADWHTGAAFRKTEIDQNVLLGYSHYRRILYEEESEDTIPGLY